MTSEVWFVIAISSFWAWVVTSLLFIFKAFPRYGIFNARLALIWGSESFFCAILWVVALRIA